MSLKEIMMMLTLSGRKVSMATRIAGMIFLVIVSLVILFAGVINGSGLAILIGGIWTGVSVIITAIVIIYNVFKNRPRW